ncbi:ATP-binding protein [Streptomyces caniscabiei]|uniref:sensor histidine kinase n=1 Tax=Streptomyces caniscabiei TaxID=2746961 RepID=UPI0029A8DEB1|nr:ATP-binding protein [Streptomyces caniscabiei]MDX2776650.1 ATP-binding protein [Streptomyces caniscabiei]
MDLLILFLTCAVNLTLGLFVLSRDIKQAHTRLFVLTSFLISAWITANYFTNYYTADLDITNLANKLAFVTGFGLILSELLFTYTFPIKRNIPRIEAVGVAAMSAIVLVLSMTEELAGVASLHEGKLVFSVGPLIWVFVIGFVAITALMARNLLQVKPQDGNLKFRQARLILLAFGSTASLGILLNVIIPSITGDWSTTHYSPLVTVVLVAIIAYTIVKHGLFDIRLAAVRSVAYVFSLLTLAGFYYLTAFGISELFIQDSEAVAVSQSPVSIGLALVLAFVFQPVKKFFDKLTNSIFFHDNYSTDDFLARLGEELSTASDLRNLLQRASTEIANTIQAEQGFFFVRYNSHHVNAGTPRHGSMTPQDIAVLDSYIEWVGSKAVVTDLINETESAYSLLKRHKIAIVLPLMRDGRALSYLFIGRRRSREYSQRDVKVLETIANELVIAIQNALSVQEVKDINATLQQRVNEATKELRATNKQLQRLDAAKDEFVSMASHQLRTPLTSVKGYISMVLEGDVGRITGQQRELLEEAFTSSERMVHLISDFLNVSRLKTGKFIIDRRPSDLVKLIDQEVASMQSTARAHNMELTFRKPAYFPILYVDEAKIRQVIMNFIDNAIYYSREATEIKVSLVINDGSAILTVKDTGIGVPKAEQAHLFTKFFRASNARRQRPDGTGVGLYLAKKVIIAHGGSMLFESVEGEGSTFGFRLPIKRLSEAAAGDADELDYQPHDDKDDRDGN